VKFLEVECCLAYKWIRSIFLFSVGLPYASFDEYLYSSKLKYSSYSRVFENTRQKKISNFNKKKGNQLWNAQKKNSKELKILIDFWKSLPFDFFSSSNPKTWWQAYFLRRSYRPFKNACKVFIEVCQQFYSQKFEL
jgi:PhoPQ-activated pathogenicity-related protein